jgi:hypothetical protein
MRWMRRLSGSKATRRAMCAQWTTVTDEQVRLADAFVESYVAWREQCAEVQCAYERWVASRDDSGLAYSIYNAELDLEERAARAYRDATERLAVATRPVTPSEAYRPRDRASSV